MTPSKVTWALAGGLALVLSGATPLRAQSSVAAQCEAAAKVIAKGHPATTDDWAFVELRGCGRAGARAFADGLGHYAGERDIDVLRRFMDRVDDWRDASIFDAALAMATNASATPQARVYAVRHLIALLIPQRHFLYDGLAKGLDSVRAPDGGLRFNLACQSIVTAEHSGTLSGDPLPPGYEARIRATLRSIADSPSTPAPVRNASRCASLSK